MNIISLQNAIRPAASSFIGRVPAIQWFVMTVFFILPVSLLHAQLQISETEQLIEIDPKQQNAQAIFDLHNTGTAPVTIKRITTDNPKVNYQLQPRVRTLRAGQSTQLLVTTPGIKPHRTETYTLTVETDQIARPDLNIKLTIAPRGWQERQAKIAERKAKQAAYKAYREQVMQHVTMPDRRVHWADVNATESRTLTITVDPAVYPNATLELVDPAILKIPARPTPGIHQPPTGPMRPHEFHRPEPWNDLKVDLLPGKNTAPGNPAPGNIPGSTPENRATGSWQVTITPQQAPATYTRGFLRLRLTPGTPGSTPAPGTPGSSLGSGDKVNAEAEQPQSLHLTFMIEFGEAPRRRAMPSSESQPEGSNP